MQTLFGKAVRYAARIFLSSVVSAALALAQSTAGDIIGMVHDPSGAVVPNVKVKIVQEETNFTRETASNTEGIYEFRILPPGTYTLTAEAAGFKRYANERLPLVSRQVLRIDISMVVGNTSDSITVLAEAPVVNTETGTVDETRGSRMLSEGPVGTPIMTTFAALTGRNSLVVRDGGAGGGGSFKAAGSRGGQWETSVDGNAVDPTNFSMPAQAILEEKVTVVNSSAEYRTPVTIDAVGKQGTNRFRGSSTFQLSHPALNALPATATSSKRGPQVPSHLWNLTAGGPLYMPKLYDGRNRTFLFLSMERVPPTSGIASSRLLDVPTATMRRGDYSKYFAAVGQPNKTLTDPLTGLAFPGNVIPNARLNPVAMKIVQGYLPAPNITTANPEVPFRNGEATPDSANVSTWSTIVVRLDQKITSRNTAGFSYNQNPLQATLAEPLPALGTSSRIGGSKQYNWTDTHIVSPTIVNEARVSFFNFDNSRYGNSGRPQSSFIDAVGMDLGADAASRKSYRQLPRISVTGFIYGDGGTVGSTYVDDSRFQRWLHFRDNLSVQYRKHTFKFGYDHRFKRDARLPASASIGSQQTYNGQYSGEAFADFLLGLPQGTARFTAGVPLLDRRYNELGVFVQDSYKVNQRLTLTFGLRLDRLSPRTEVHGAFDVFDPGTGAIMVPDQQSLSLIHPAFPKSIPIKTAEQAGFSRTLLNPARTLAPRIGFAYRATQRGNLVVRGGWGMYSVDAGSSLNNFRLFDSGPFSLTETFLNPGKLIGVSPLVTLDRPFPSSLGAVPASVSAGGAPPNIGIPVTQQYNLTIERQLAGKWMGKLGYVGSRSTQAWYTVDMNRPPAGLTPYAQVPKRFPLYQSISWFDKGANAWYSALQAGLTHRFSSGLEFDSLFQWISELTDAQDLGLRTNAFTGGDNPFCRACDKGKNQSVDSLDFRSNFLYELPVGRNKRFGGGWNRAARGIAGGWVVSGIVDLRNGRPEAIFFSGPDPSNTNLRTGRVDVVPGCNYQSGDGNSAPYLNIACFAIPKTGTFGNSTTSQFRKPGSWDVSGAVYKYFPLFREDVKLRINAVFNNLFNHPTWNTVGNNISTPASFGKFSSQGAAGRLSGARSIVLQAQVQW